jgi:hypothetical protein
MVFGGYADDLELGPSATTSGSPIQALSLFRLLFALRDPPADRFVGRNSFLHGLCAALVLLQRIRAARSALFSQTHSSLLANYVPALEKMQLNAMPHPA